MPVYWEVFLDGAGDELDRIARGPDMHTVAAWETALLTGYSLSEARAHVIRGVLKASGHPSSHHGADSWEGTIAFARNPGIFELARGPDTPTRYHPEGGHYFFDPGGPLFEKMVRQAFWDWITDDKGGPAPSGGLGPYSGGD